MNFTAKLLSRRQNLKGITGTTGTKGTKGTKDTKRMSGMSGIKGILASTLLTLASVLAAPYAISQEGSTGAAGNDKLEIYAQAGADQAQLAKMRKLAQEYDANVRPVFQSLIAASQEMQKLSLEPTLDQQKILSTQEQINKAMCDMSLQKCRFLISLREVLTDEQRKKLVELLRARRASSGTPAPGTP